MDSLILVQGSTERPSIGAAWLLRLNNAIFRRLSIDTILQSSLHLYTPWAEDHDLTRTLLQQSFTRDKEPFFNPKYMTFPSFTELLPSITAPTLVIIGERFAFEHNGAHMLYERIPQPQRAIFVDAFVPVSTMRKDIFNEMVLDVDHTSAARSPFMPSSSATSPP